MGKNKFDYTLADAQGTIVEPLAPERFDIEKYCDYEAELLERNRFFWNAPSGVAVYRRFRVPQVFAAGCRDMEYSLSLQLAALNESMKYRSDIANFLEPWYGIGTIAGAFGLEYVWHDNQAPATRPTFQSLAEALRYSYQPVENTPVGKHTLTMVEYFLDKTQGRIPISFCDIQSPLNVASYLMDMTNLFLEIYDYPEEYQALQEIIVKLMIEFYKKQAGLIKGALVAPGHGFASSRAFTGLGMSDDNMLMISGAMYEELEALSRSKAGDPFGGAVIHSCGNWSRHLDAVKTVKNLRAVDGAFGAETDPDPNPCEPFTQALAGSGILLNARIVGDPDTVAETVKKLWKPGLKLIVNTYCKTPAEQDEAYRRIHEICR